VNGPRNSIASGPVDAIADLREKLGARNIACRDLKTSHAFHSAMLDPILAEFESEVRRAPRSAPQIPLLSSLHGREATAAEWTDPAYWSAQLRRTVRFADALAPLLTGPSPVLLEVGPGQTLTALVRQQPGKQTSVLAVPSSARLPDESDSAALLAATGKLWQAGVGIEWSALGKSQQRRKVVLPTYPFERKRFWIEPAQPSAANLSDEIVPDPGKSSRAPVAPDEIEAVIGEQLRLMTRQIEILRQAPAPAVAGERKVRP
jgi:acyl transferase domain-containing protein